MVKCPDRRLTEVVLSTPTVVATLAFVIVAVMFRLSRDIPTGADAAGIAVVLTGPRFVAYVVGPTWITACCVWTIARSGTPWRLRAGSRGAHMVRELRNSVPELAIVAAPAVVAFVVVAASSHGLGMASAWVGVVARCLTLALALVAVRATILAAALTAGSRATVFVLAVILAVCGPLVATGRPLVWLDSANWLTWAVPGLSAELTGVSYLGLALFPAWIVLMLLVTARPDRRTLATLAKRPLIRIAAFVGLFVWMQALLLQGMAALHPLSFLDAFALIYEGPQIDGLGVPLTQVLFAILVFYGPTVLMLHRLEDERGGWLLLVLIRSKTRLAWALRFLGSSCAVAILALAVSPLSTVIAWLLLPDASRTDIPSELSAPLIALRYFAIGVMQVSFYIVATFLAVWITERPMAGGVTVFALVIAGLVNPLLGGHFPAYLNGIARISLGWRGFGLDLASVLLALVVVTTAVILTTRWHERRPLVERNLK